MAFTANQTAVAELYIAALGRAPENDGLDYWVGRLDGTTGDILTIDQIRAEFMNADASAEVAARFPADQTNTTLVENIYQNVLSRAGDQAGIDYWVSRIDGTNTDGEAQITELSDILDHILAAAKSATNDNATLQNKLLFGEKVYTDTAAVIAAGNTVTYTEAALATSTITDAAATLTAANTALDTFVADNTVEPTPAGETFTLTTGVDNFAMTAGNDTVSGTVGTLQNTDVIQDKTTTDNDTLTADFSDVTGTGIKATISNIENVNLTWKSNADLELNSVNSSGNTFNLSGDALAFSGNATIDEAGTNDYNFGSGITGDVSLQEVVNSNIDLNSAATLTLTKGTVTEVGAKTTANVSFEGNTTLTNAAATGVEVVTLTADVADKTVTLSAGDQIVTSLTAQGTNSMTIKGEVAGEKVVNELTAGTLTIKSTDTGATDTTKVSADVIELTKAATDITVADNQNFLVKEAAAATLASFTAGTGVSNATVNLESQMGATAITSLTATGISTLNLDSQAVTTISTLVLDEENNVFIKGDSATTISAMTGSTAISIDANALTAGLTVTSTTVDAATGIIGSSTAANNITTAATTAKTTVYGGEADDKITVATTTGDLVIKAGNGKNTIDASAVTTGDADITSGTGNDTVDLSALTSGKAVVNTGAGDDTITLGAASTTATEITIDAGTGTDTLKVANAVDLSAAKTFDITGVETLAIKTGSTLAASQLDGQSYAVKALAANGTLNIDVTNPDSLTSLSNDLSSLSFSTVNTSNFSTVNITGLNDVADAIKATSMDDTIDLGNGNYKDTADISQGGNDTIVIANGDSSYATGKDYMDSITGFDAVVTATAFDKVQFATDITADTGATDVDVKGAITGGTGLETVTATIDAGDILSIAGTDASSIDTLAEWLVVAETALEAANGAANVADGETLAFQFAGNTYLYNAVNAAADNDIDSANVVELVGVTGITALDFAGAAAANTIVVG